MRLTPALAEGGRPAQAHAAPPRLASAHAAGHGRGRDSHGTRPVRAAYPVAPEEAAASLRCGAAGGPRLGAGPGTGPEPLCAAGGVNTGLMAEDAETLAGLHASHLEAVAAIVGDSLSASRDTPTGRRLRRQVHGALTLTLTLPPALTLTLPLPLTLTLTP